MIFKKIAIVATAVSVLACSAFAEVNWVDSMSAARALSKKEKKPILMLVASPTCHYCTMMLDVTFENASVQSTVNKNFIPVLLGSTSAEIPGGLSVRGLPTIYILGDKDKPIGAPIVGMKYPKDFVEVLESTLGKGK